MRYPTVQELAADVARFLDRLPVTRVSREPRRTGRPLRPPESRAAASAGDLSRGKVRVVFSVPALKEFRGTRNQRLEERVMNKPVVGIVVGAILGILDGATAWFTPAVAPGDRRHPDGLGRQRHGGRRPERHVRAQSELDRGRHRRRRRLRTAVRLAGRDDAAARRQPLLCPDHGPRLHHRRNHRLPHTTNGDFPERIALMPRPIHFEIPADNPERLIAFYQTVFGWTLPEMGGRRRCRTG